MFKIKVMLTLVVLLLVSVGGALAQNERLGRFEDVRALGMGGVGITTMNGFNAIIYNPALIADADRSLALPDIQATLGKEILDLWDFVEDNEDNFDGFDTLSAAQQSAFLEDITPWDDNWMGAGVNVSAGLVMSGIAVGSYATARVDTKLDKGVIASPRVFMKGQAEWVKFTVGMGQKLPGFLPSFFTNDLTVGAALKVIERRSTSLQLSAADSDFDAALDSLKENKYTGFGLDVGLLYDVVPDKIQAGMSVTNLIGSVEDQELHPIVNFGSSYKMGSFLFSADYRDFFRHYGGNVFNRLYVGAEYAVGGIVSLRGGVAQGYPSVGIGLDLVFLKLDGAVHGFERTASPGGDGDYNYTARLGLGF